MNTLEQILIHQLRNIYEYEGVPIGTCELLYDWLITQMEIDFDSATKKELWKKARLRCASEKKKFQSLPADELKTEQIKYYKSELVSKFLLSQPKQIEIISTITNKPIPLLNINPRV